MSDGNRELPGWRLLDLCVTLAAWLVESLVGSLLSHRHWLVMASTAWPRFGMPPVSITQAALDAVKAACNIPPRHL